MSAGVPLPIMVEFMQAYDPWHLRLKWSFNGSAPVVIPASSLIPAALSGWGVSLNSTTNGTTGCTVVGMSAAELVCRPSITDTIVTGVRLDHAATGLSVSQLITPVALVRAGATTTTTGVITANPSDSLGDKVVLSVGAVVGIAVGSFSAAGVLAVILIVVAVRFRRRITPQLSRERAPTLFDVDDVERFREYELRRGRSMDVTVSTSASSSERSAMTLRVTQLVSPPSRAGSASQSCIESRDTSLLSPEHERSTASFGTGDYRRASVGRAGKQSSVDTIVGLSASAEHTWEIPYDQLDIGDKLGEGAYGVVYKATWRFRPCVVKQIKLERDVTAVAAFMREAERMQMLRPHPAVVQMLGVCTQVDAPVCIVTEYVNGGTLQDVMFDEYIAPEALLRAFHDVATGMNHLHNENIIHCDLAARNVLISRQGNDFDCKVADFGLSHFTDTGTYYGEQSVKIPIRWCSPEVIRQRRFSKKSDVWAMGVLMWEVLAKSVPYPEMSVQEVIAKVCNEGYRLPKPSGSYPPELYSGLMFDCWLAEVDARPDFASICRRLETMRSATTVRAHPLIREQSFGYVDADVVPMDDDEDIPSTTIA
eukprot:TRINITY_DN30819_c0_g1_i1.p1 TRINITY_DN30819_c0_g1~~TRINITY_DN30819_c0_g1_i1.p1  ORF type:complete len:595 (+),score=153.16 TRINITY_DN30819_c0_g1_i1:616-2400(+)